MKSQQVLRCIRTGLPLDTPLSSSQSTTTDKSEDIVWSWGAQVGPTPRPMADAFNNRAVTQVVCSESHTLFLTDLGEVWGRGDNKWGQLGLGHLRSVPAASQAEIFAGKYIIEIACGIDFSLALDDSRNVYSWGRGKDGRLGNESDHNQCTPLPIPRLMSERIIHIACGASHALCVSSSGKVFSWGASSFGRLGRKVANAKAAGVPTEVALDDKISLIAAGSVTSFAYSATSATLWGWGSNQKGQLGIAGLVDYNVPQKITSMQGKVIEEIVASGTNTLIRTARPAGVYSLSSTYIDAFGHRQTKPQLTDWSKQPNRLPVDSVVQIACSPRSFMALTRAGKVWGWGDNTYGQLGCSSSGPVDLPMPLRCIEEKKVYRVACSRDDTIAVLGVIRNALGELYKPLIGQQTLADVMFCFAEGQHAQAVLYGHKIIVALRCASFARAYFKDYASGHLSPTDNVIGERHEQQEKIIDKVEIAGEDKEVTCRVLHGFMTYLYTDSLDIGSLDTAELVALMRLASRYNLPRLALMADRKKTVVFSPSTFTTDLAKGVNNPLYSDVCFIIPTLTPVVITEEEKEKEKEKEKEVAVADESVAGSTLVFASKVILATRSTYFAALFLGAGKEMRKPGEPEDIIRFDEEGIDCATLCIFLEFIYTGKLVGEAETKGDGSFTPDAAISLLSVANLYHFEALRDKCESTVQKAVDVESAAFVWASAKMAGATRLENFCLDYIATYWPDICKSEAFCMLPETDQHYLASLCTPEPIKKV
eukprot:TRINITY_DN1421_c0_g1_i11.p1 TRINITY_DN1421_c0_g1~~TRINITY_DN1421_c0_g1_i11.p1  ORF type:complete len:765 (-),score=114.63 TRINITY_DN1421_c0_g1_i11:8-2302(-)